MIMIFFLFSFIYKEAPSALQRTRWEFREWDIMYTHRNISIFVSWISSHHFFYVRLFALVFIVVFLFISSQSIQLHFPIKSCPCCLTAFFLPNAVSAVGPQNTIGHPTQRHEGFKQVPVVSAYGIQQVTRTAIGHPTQSCTYKGFKQVPVVSAYGIQQVTLLRVTRDLSRFPW